MGRLKSWLDWSVLALCTITALGAAIYGANVMDAWPLARGVHGRPDSGGLATIAALTAVNFAFLIGAAVCKARRDVRLRRR
jgi:hypothetical protein